MSWPRPPAAVFFDLDGTLLDSAPDLIVAVERLAAELAAPPPDAEAIRRVVSAGGRAMLRVGLPGVGEERIDELLPRFLDIYSRSMTFHTRLFEGMPEVLARLEGQGVPWGIVTNKPGWLARPMLAEMDFFAGCAALVTGDCLPVRKPDPAPLHLACELAGVAAAQCVFVGDDLRDIQAGHGARMPTIAAAWGYLDGGDPAAWGADGIVGQPVDLVAALGLS
ncbi:MAG: HAD-IA family hydrolase [Xanthomonadales bacterium]|nr:HAD-IA family hydrolase [Xanthomonadales bacterium]